MPEVAAAGKDHGGARLLDCRDHFCVPFGAARLDDRGDARRGRLIYPIPEGKERIAREHSPLRVMTLLPCLVDRKE